MANIKSAEKRIKVSATKKLQNQMIRSQMQTAVKKFNAAIAEGNTELAKSLLPICSKQIDEAARKNVIHKNAANRKKSQIAKALSQLERGIVVVKVDAKTLKQAEQKAAAQRRAEEAAAIKAQRNEAKRAREAAKNPTPVATTKAKKGTKTATATADTADTKPTTRKRTKKTVDAPAEDATTEDVK